MGKIAELEKDSINYFDIEKEFFLIDSDNLSQVHTKLYGYSIQQSGIYEDDNLTVKAIAGLDGRGCYVYVEVKDGQITIKQDSNGSWGIYLFRHGDYFALSNSFFRLVDHVKFKYPLTVNRDFCSNYMLSLYASCSYSETAVNEIQLLDRSAIIQINVAEKNLEVELIDCKDHSVSLDSAEGIAILDSWVDFWANVFRGLVQSKKFIQTDLSGGFDSRVSIIPLLHANIDLSQVKINSRMGTLHTYKEDYAIASRIAKHYGFKLNQPLPTPEALNYSLSDALNLNSYFQQTFRNVPTASNPKRNVEKIYYFNGHGGENIRRYWHVSPRELIDGHKTSARFFSPNVSRELSSAIEVILKSGFRSVQKKYGIQDQNSPYIPQYLYKETRSRYHFGKSSACACMLNVVLLSPLMDPALQALKLDTSECPDSNLLITLLLSRFEPDLLTFPFDSNHSIAPETIEYAKKINERFPLGQKNTAGAVEEDFHLPPPDEKVKRALALGRNNIDLPANLLKDCLKAMFESSRTYGLINMYFDAELYTYAANYYESGVLAKDRPAYSILGVARILEDVEISQRNHLPYRDMQRFLEQDFATIHKNPQIPVKLRAYITARIDIKLMTTEGDFQILSVSDDKASVGKPAWFQGNGIGYQIQSYAEKLEFIAKATVAGQISLNLRGMDIRTPEDKSKRIPYWIDYTKLVVNGETVFDTLTPAWHDKPYTLGIEAKADEEIKIQVEWQPHRSDT
ncbi:MAG: hypothetical protein IJG33_13455 [Selenomonadaceae bacterium]|nr:hypothetical protein [Selenomonadaceae bacterium]